MFHFYQCLTVVLISGTNTAVPTAELM